MTTDERLTLDCVEHEMAHFSRAFATGSEQAIDNAEADFDNLIAWLDELQQSNGPDAELASVAVLEANAARLAVLDTWAEA